MNIGNFLKCIGSGSLYIQIIDVGGNTPNWKGAGGFPPQGGTTYDKESTQETNLQRLGLTILGVGDEGIMIGGGGGLYHLDTKHDETVYCDMTNNGPVYGGGAQGGGSGV